MLLRRRALSLVFGAGCLALTACARPPELVDLRGACMGTTWSLRYVPGADSPEPGVLQEQLGARLEEIEDVFSLWRPESEISRFNALRSTEPMEVSPAMAEVVELALEIAARTVGVYDPTIAPLARLQRFGPEHGPEPTAEQLAAAAAKVDYRKLQLREKNLRKLDPGLELDLNSIAKGWAVDQLVQFLAERLIVDCMVEIGGEIRCAGVKPDGSPWRIAVEQPRADALEVGEVVELRDLALATSGDYRNFRVQGDAQKVHHILRPDTGTNQRVAPAAVSVRAKTCALADGLATALMLLGAEHAQRLIDAFPSQGVAVLVMERDASGAVQRRTFGW